MNTKLLLSTIVAITVVATVGIGLTSNQKLSSAYADTPVCTQTEVPINGSTLSATYTIPTGYGGDPSKFSGQCVVDSTAFSTSHPCTVNNGIANAGYCEMVTKGYEVTDAGPATLPTEEWFHLSGITLKPGQFLDIVDTTPFITTKGHVAMILPCDTTGKPLVRLYQGIIDAGVNTLGTPKYEYLQHLSDPTNGICAYHFDIGSTPSNPMGVTDFAIVNVSKKDVTFGDRNTSTFSITDGYQNKMG